jgi:hypothetical protein
MSSGDGVIFVAISNYTYTYDLIGASGMEDGNWTQNSVPGMPFSAVGTGSGFPQIKTVPVGNTFVLIVKQTIANYTMLYDPDVNAFVDTKLPALDGNTLIFAAGQAPSVTC